MISSHSIVKNQSRFIRSIMKKGERIKKMFHHTKSKQIQIHKKIHSCIFYDKNVARYGIT